MGITIITVTLMDTAASIRGQEGAEVRGTALREEDLDLHPRQPPRVGLRRPLKGARRGERRERGRGKHGR